MTPQDVAGEAIQAVYANVQKVFTAEVIEETFPGVPVPRVSLDMPGDEPEPLHVFVWGTARNFDAEGFLSGSYIEASFHVYVSVIATSSTAERASEIANAYQALALQLVVVDPLLGGIVTDSLAPKIEESATWVDASGSRHAGYLLDFGYTKYISASEAVARALKE